MQWHWVRIVEQGSIFVGLVFAQRGPMLRIVVPGQQVVFLRDAQRVEDLGPAPFYGQLSSGSNDQADGSSSSGSSSSPS